MTTRSTADGADDAVLSQFGYQEELRRSMGSYSSFALSFSMISVTTTVFTLFAQPFQTVGGIAIWLWIPVIAGVLLLAAVYGHLAVRLPITGYAYHWASRLVNPHYGWFTGYNAFLCQFIGSAGIAVALASVFAPDFWAQPTHADIILLASVAVVVAVVVNITSIALTAHVNNVGASFELIGTIGFTAMLGIGLAFFHHVQGPHVLVQHGSSVGTPITITAVASALLLPIWTLAGWEGAADLAEETHDPRRAAPKAMMRAVLISGAAGLVVFAVFAMSIGGNLAHTVNSTSTNPMVAIFQSHFGSIGSFLLQVVAFVAMFSCLLANVTVATRTSYSLARDNMLPFSKVLARVNPTTRTPVASVIAVGIVAIGVNFLSSGVAVEVTGMVSVVLYLTYGSTLISALVGAARNRIPDAPSEYFNIGRALRPLCIIGIVWSAVVVVCMTAPTASHVIGYYTLGFEVAAGLWYVLVLRRRLALGTAGPRLAPLSDLATAGSVHISDGAHRVGTDTVAPETI
ncbi:MAG: APC family permease [Mycobacteriaceae bacterium]